MQALFSDVKRSALLSIGLGVGLLMLGGVITSANADVVRAGANGNTATTTRTAQDGALTRTTTGPNGNLLPQASRYTRDLRKKFGNLHPYV